MVKFLKNRLQLNGPGMEPNPQPENNTQWVPVFPLPSTVFFPTTDLPLHIFEPRYREMVRDALAGDGKIGMVLLKPGWETNYYDKPDTVSVGCLGQIDRHTEFPDGKFNILLKGLSRFRIVNEFGGKQYRRMEVESLREINDQLVLGEPNSIKDRLIETCMEFVRQLPKSNPAKFEKVLHACKLLSGLVDQLAHRLDLTVEQKQSFLQERDVLKRVDFIHSALKMKIDLIRMSRARLNKGIDIRLN